MPHQHLRAVLVLAIVLAGAALFVPAASAATYCVSLPSCVTAGGTSEPDINTALAAAAASPGLDDVHIGPGTYQANGGFAYTSADPVRIVGSGTGENVDAATTLEDSTPTPSGENVLKLSGSSASSVANVAIGMPRDGAQNTGLALTSGTATNINVHDQPGQQGAVGEGVQLTGATLTRSSVFTYGVSDDGVDVEVGPASLVQDVRIRADADGVLIGPNTSATVRRCVITYGAAGVGLDQGGRGLVDSSVLHLEGVTAYAYSGAVYMPQGGASATVLNSTLVGEDAPADASAGVYMYSADATTADNAVVRNSVLTGFASSFHRYTAGTGVDNVTTSRSVYSAFTDTAAGARNEGRINLPDPGFANLQGDDFHLRADSPLIDRGLEIAGESATDAAGEPRVVSGGRGCVRRPDIGAYEFQPGPRPPVAVIHAPKRGSTGVKLVFKATGSCDPDGGRLRLAWRFDDGGHPTGVSVRHAFARAGTHMVALTVTDVTNRRTTVYVLVKVTKSRHR
jgi:hypothetical protein